MLGDLLQTVVDGIGPMFRVADLEGDAVFAYAQGTRLDASLLLDGVESCFFTFQRRLRDIGFATTCRCNACALVPKLTLKFILHVGAFTRQQVAGREQLAGTDVVLAHRLLKNRVSELLGHGGYALFTAACIGELRLDPVVLGLREHHERYEHLGEVIGYVEDLAARWRFEEERHRVFVSEADSLGTVEAVLPALPAVVWDYITAPEKRPLWHVGMQRVDETTVGGRRGLGTRNHCVHGREQVVEEVVDRRPFESLTFRRTPRWIPTYLHTLELTPEGTATRIASRIGRPHGTSGTKPSLLLRLLWPLIRGRARRAGRRDVVKSFARLADLVSTVRPAA